MFILQYVKPEEATGAAKEAYAVFPPEMGAPEPLQLFSASEQMLASAMDSLGYFMRHPRLEFPVLAAIRLMAAQEFCHDYCAALNAGMLRRAGLTEEDMQALTGNLEGLPFEANELALLRLVQQVVKAPKTVSESDVQACRDAGWSDSDIFDACCHAANMQVSNLLMDAFRK